jgi:hypothetical protein
MPLFPPPLAPVPPLVSRQVREVLRCQESITKSGQKFVKTQSAEVEACALDILYLRLLYENDLVSGEEYDEQLDRIRDKCDARFRRVEKSSSQFVDAVIDACDPIADLILDDYDSLRFELLEDVVDDEIGGAVDFSSVPLLAGSLCGLKSLFVQQLIAFQIPRALELFSHLGADYIVLVDEDGFEFGYIDLPLDGRCRIPEA